MTLTRRLYLVIFALVLLLAIAAAGLYARQRAFDKAKAAAACDTPAPPPPPAATPPPKLPGFEVEAGCGPGEAPKPSAEKKK